MISDNSKNNVNELLSILTESDKEAIPRIIMVNCNNKLWKQTIAEAIDRDRILFKSDSYVITCRRYLGDGFEVREFKGQLSLTLQSILTCIDEIDNMVITVKNLSYIYIKGKKLQKIIKLVYIIIQS